MTRTQGSHTLLAQLEAVLASYGAQPQRWPEAVRARLCAFVEQDSDAGRLVAEARALERMLHLASEMTPPEGLEARILAAAASLLQDDKSAAAGASPVPADRAGKPRAHPHIAARTGRRIWPELTLLAASLFLGLLIGLSGQALPALQDVAVFAGDDPWGGVAGLLFDAGAAPDQEAL